MATAAVVQVAVVVALITLIPQLLELQILVLVAVEVTEVHPTGQEQQVGQVLLFLDTQTHIQLLSALDLQVQPLHLAVVLK
jgi:putative exporter of polyketide antibiotics